MDSMGHPNVNEKRKYKKKSNFLRHTKKLAKRNCNYGRGMEISQEQYNYYLTMFEHLKQVKGEERELLVRNFLIGITEEKEVKKLASNQIVSRILDSALPYGEVPQVLALSQIFVEDLRSTCLDPYASHVLQTLMALALKFTQKNAVQKNTTAENEAENEEEKIFLTKEQRKEFKLFLNKVGRFVFNNLDEFIKDSYGSHVFRSVLETCSGVQLQDSLRSSDKSQTKHALCHDAGQILRVPKKLQELLVEIAARLLQLPDLPGIITDVCGSTALQSALIVLKGTKNEECIALLDHILVNGFPNIVPMLYALDHSYEDLDHSYEEATTLPWIFINIPAVRLLEAMLSCATIEQLSGIFTQYFKGHIIGLVSHKLANFAVQKLLLSWQDKETFLELFEEVQLTLPAAIEAKHTGVIYALSQACRRLQKSQGRCWKEIMKLLRCYEPEERQQAAAPCLLWFLNYDEYQKKQSEGELPPISLHGSLILQDFLHFMKTIKIVTSVLSMKLGDLQLMASDPRGSHVVDAFTSSTFIKANNKEKLIHSFKGKYVALACSKHGSRSLEAMWNAASTKSKTKICEELVNEELKLKGNQHGLIIYNKFMVSLFKRNDQQDWQVLVDSAAKKKRLLDEFMSDVTGDEPETKKQKKNFADEPEKKKKKKKKIHT